MGLSNALRVDYPQEYRAMIDSGVVIPLILPSQKDGELPPGVCQNCGGVGYVFVFEPKPGAKPMLSPNGEKAKWLNYNGHSGWVAGETKQLDCPACSNGNTKAWLEKRCGLTGRDLEVSLESFSVSGELAGKKPAREMAASILGMNQGAHGITTFYGPYGSGKTHLLKAIVNGLRGVGLWSLYANLSDLLADIRGRFGEPNGQREVANVIDFYRSIRVLCLDEFDRVNLTGWTLETIFRLVDDRYSNMDKLLTVFASNSSLTDLPAEFGYLVSRLKQGNVTHVPGPDMRPAVKEIEHWTDKI